METIFQRFNVRFISINDHYDSADIASKKDVLSIPLKNIMNEQYSKDLSRKLTSAFRTRQMEGKFIGGFTTYGYLKDQNDNSKLVVDQEIAPVIRRIFQCIIDGMSDGAIANELNDEGILSPFAYRYDKGLVRAEKYKSMPWKRGTIEQKILDEEEYAFIKEEYDRQIKAITAQIKELRKYRDSFKTDYTVNKESNQKIKTYVHCKQLNRKIVEAFISQVKVMDETHIEITMDCKDQIEKALRIAEKSRLDLHEDR